MDVQLEIFEGGLPDGPVVCAAHPTEALVAGTTNLLADACGGRIFVVNPRGLGGSSPGDPTLDAMVGDLEAVREALGLERWAFWGMSGGGWLAQVYARRHPASLSGIVVESACASVRTRLADPACILSPRHPRWADTVEALPLRDGWTDVLGIGSVYAEDGEAVLVSPEALSSTVRRRLPPLLDFDARPWLGDLDVPTLVVAGTTDPIAPLPHVRAVHDGIPGSRWLEVPGGAHVPVTEDAHRAAIGDAVRALLL